MKKKTKEVRRIYIGYPYHEIHTTTIAYSWGMKIYPSLERLKAAIEKKHALDRAKSR